MSETPQTNTPDRAQNQPTFPGNDFDQILQMQESQAARRIVEQAQEETVNTAVQEKNKSSLDKGAAVGLAAGIALTAAFGLPAVDYLNGPEFSEETTTYTLQPGEGLYDIADQVLGSETVNTNVLIDHIAGDPANIDVLVNDLQPGDTLVIPVSVKK